MDELPIFTAALDICSPWHIKRIHFEFEEGKKKLYIQVAHTRRTKFAYDGIDCPVYDHQERWWKHLNFFLYEPYIYGQIPRVKTPDGSVRLVEVPWTQLGSSFTLQFEYAYPTLGQAYRLCELFKQVMDEALTSKRLRPLNDWIKMAWASGLAPIRNFVNMLHNHWYGIKTYFKKVADNAFAERVNLKIQEIKRIAKGYRNINNFILMIYFHIGGLKFETH